MLRDERDSERAMQGEKRRKWRGNSQIRRGKGRRGKEGEKKGGE